jgi:hypothetical protein
MFSVELVEISCTLRRVQASLEVGLVKNLYSSVQNHANNVQIFSNTQRCLKNF